MKTLYYYDMYKIYTEEVDSLFSMYTHCIPIVYPLVYNGYT